MFTLLGLILLGFILCLLIGAALMLVFDRLIGLVEREVRRRVTMAAERDDELVSR